MTGNKEDYIKVIYELGGERNRISTKDMATALEISPPSVSEMLRKLEKWGVIEYELYRGVKLTEKGIREAVRIKKNHILWEVFLVEKLGYDLADVHEEAERLEHITSKKLGEKLEKYLGYPKICPHGTPLEHHEYLFSYLPIDESLVGKSLILKRLQDDKQFLRDISTLNLKLEDKLEILEFKEEKFIIRVNKKIIELSTGQASKIFVSKENV